MDWFSGALLTISGCYLAIHFAARRVDRKHQARLDKLNWELRRLHESGKQIEKILISLKEGPSETKEEPEEVIESNEKGSLLEGLPEEACS